jgi:hypothetical protein
MELKVEGGGRRINAWWYAIALVLAWVFYQVFQILFWQWPTNLPIDQGPGPFIRAKWIENGVMAALAVASLIFLPGGQRLDRSRGRLRQMIIFAVFIVFFAMHVDRWRVNQRSAWLWVEDVGSITVEGDRALFHGLNPYVANVNPVDYYVVDPRLHGYKYFPVMMAAYAPAVALEPDGGKAILLANMIFSVIAAAVLFACAGRWISVDAGLLCGTLFFMSRLISEELVQRGSNDVVPMILVVLGLLWLENRFASGLLIGLAISCKLVPGLLWVPICLTPQRRGRYIGGLAAGLLPSVMFLLWDPVPFVRNAVLFPLTRPRDGQSPLFGAPGWACGIAEAGVMIAWLMFLNHVRRVEMPALRRCAWAAGLTLLFQLVSPGFHQNYFIWWYMPLCIAVTALIFNPAMYGWIGKRRGLRTED